MADMIKMTPSQMRQYASQYQNGSQTIDDLLNQLTSLQSQIEADWQGSGFEHFDNEFRELVPKIRQFSQLLNEINQKLNQSAQAMEDTDNQIASRFEYLIKDIPL